MPFGPTVFQFQRADESTKKGDLSAAPCSPGFLLVLHGAPPVQGVSARVPLDGRYLPKRGQFAFALAGGRPAMGKRYLHSVLTLPYHRHGSKASFAFPEKKWGRPFGEPHKPPAVLALRLAAGTPKEGFEL